MKQLFIVVLFFVNVVVYGQNHIATEVVEVNSFDALTNSIDFNDHILRYMEFLREEARLHREWTQEYYLNILRIFSALGIVVVAVLTWLNWKSRKNIEKQIALQFKGTVEEILNTKIEQLDSLITENKEKSSKQFKEINKIITENKEQLDSLITENKEKSSKQFKEINKMILELTKKSSTIKDQLIEDSKNNKTDMNDLNGKAVLWVDDCPENNNYPKEMLELVGVKFDIALETKSALDILNKKKFDLIISDMGRHSNPSAGLELLKLLNESKINTPVIIFSSMQAVRKYGDEALKLGAIECITGFVELLNFIQQELLSR